MFRKMPGRVSMTNSRYNHQLKDSSLLPSHSFFPLRLYPPWFSPGHALKRLLRANPCTRLRQSHWAFDPKCACARRFLLCDSRHFRYFFTRRSTKGLPHVFASPAGPVCLYADLLSQKNVINPNHLPPPPSPLYFCWHRCQGNSSCTTAQAPRPTRSRRGIQGPPPHLVPCTDGRVWAGRRAWACTRTSQP